MNRIVNFAQTQREKLAALALMMSAGIASAQETSAAVTAYNAAKASVTENVELFAGGLVAVAAVAVVFMVGVKYVKKLGGAS